MKFLTKSYASCIPAKGFIFEYTSENRAMFAKSTAVFPIINNGLPPVAKNLSMFAPVYLPTDPETYFDLLYLSTVLRVILSHNKRLLLTILEVHYPCKSRRYLFNRSILYKVRYFFLSLFRHRLISLSELI